MPRISPNDLKQLALEEDGIHSSIPPRSTLGTKISNDHWREELSIYRYAQLYIPDASLSGNDKNEVFPKNVQWPHPTDLVIEDVTQDIVPVMGSVRSDFQRPVFYDLRDEDDVIDFIEDMRDCELAYMLA